jgi:hypothetical protein
MISNKDKAMAFRTVFGQPGKRTREQEIVWQELVGEFTLMPCFAILSGVGVDTHLAAIQSGKVEIAKTISDLVTVDMKLINDISPEVTKQKEKKSDDV